MPPFDNFQTLLALATVLQSVPPILQKRIVREMISQCQLGLSKEEVEDLDRMYDKHREYVINAGLDTLFVVLRNAIEHDNKDLALQMVEDFKLSLARSDFQVLTTEQQMLPIKESIRKYDEREKKEWKDEQAKKQ